MDNNILVFAHMMKTAGTALTKQLIAHFEAKLHLVPGGLKMDDCYYSVSVRATTSCPSYIEVLPLVKT